MTTIPCNNSTTRTNGVPPNDPKAEQIVLAAMMIDDAIIGETLGIVSSDEFYDIRHQEIAASIVRLHRDGNPVEPVTVAQDLENQGKIQIAGGLGYLERLLESPHRSVTAPYYAGLVRDASKRRHAIRIFNSTSQELRDTENIGESLSLARDKIDNLLTDRESVSTFAFNTATDFDGLDLHRDYHVPNVLAAGAVPAIMAGSFKTLKTSISMDLMISLATQHRFLKHFSIPKRVKVAVMSGESGGFALQNLARRVARSKGWSFSEIGDWFSICTAVPNLAIASDLQEIERFIVENEIGVFLLDPVYMAMRSLRGDEAGSLFAMGDLLDPLTKLAQRTECTPVIVHHNTRTSMRNNVGEPAELADIAWSGFAEWAAQWILISRREKYDPDSDGEHRLWLSSGGRDGHSSLIGANISEGRIDDSQGRRWEVEVVDAGKARADAIEASQERKAEQNESQKEKQVDDDRETIQSIMCQIGEPETKTAIRNQCGISTRRFDTAFAKLLQDNHIVKSKITKGNGRRYDAYKSQRTASDRNGPSDAVHCNRTEADHPPLGGGGSAAVLLPLDGSNNDKENGLVRSDAIGTGDDLF